MITRVLYSVPFFLLGLAGVLESQAFDDPVHTAVRHIWEHEQLDSIANDVVLDMDEWAAGRQHSESDVRWLARLAKDFGLRPGSRTSEIACLPEAAASEMIRNPCRAVGSARAVMQVSQAFEVENGMTVWVSVWYTKIRQDKQLTAPPYGIGYRVFLAHGPEGSWIPRIDVISH